MSPISSGESGPSVAPCWIGGFPSPSLTALEMVASKRYILCPFLGNEPVGVPRDHQVLVGAHHANGYGTVLSRNDRRVRRVAVMVEPDTKEREALADAPAHGCGMLPDPARKNERVQPTQGRGERPQKLLSLVAEEVDGLGCVRIVLLACQQVAHVSARPGDAEEPRLPVDEVN